MKKDILSKEDIFFIINAFYRKLLEDTAINHFFEHILNTGSLEHHLNTITDFWNGILFNATDYQRNAMQPHLDLNENIPFRTEHFKTWLHHFKTTIDTHYSGENAEKMKTRALSIATVMQIKMRNLSKSN